jgi:hypothetical protein
VFNAVITDKVRREQLRWHLMQIANVARPQGMYTGAMLPILQTVYPDATEAEVRTQLDYLCERELVKIDIDPINRWFVRLTRWGVDIVEYTVACEPGISRPIIHAQG